MSEVQTPEQVVKEAVEVKPEVPVEAKKEAAKVSPAQDLRDIQQLLVVGIYPGQMAPAVVKSFHLLEQMAQQIEKPSEK